MISSGEKREEYREIKPYWDNRMNKGHDVIRFRNGYQKDAPVMDIELKGTVTGQGKIEWGAPEAKPVYILRLGNIIELKNIKENK